MSPASRTMLVAIPIVTLGAACGDDASEVDAGPGVDAALGVDAGAGVDASGVAPFECATLSDPAQCWNRLVAELHACTPSGVGTLNAERTECTYADGTTVRFAGAVPTTGDYRPTFTVLDGAGVECGSFSSGGLALGVVSVGAGSASLQQEPGPRLRLSCRDGDVESVAFDAPFDEISGCAGEVEPLVPPGYNALFGEGFVRIQIIADGDSGPEPLVDCAHE